MVSGMIRSNCVLHLVCADARISHEVAGNKPLPELRGVEDTGRIKHREVEDGVVLFFKSGEVLVSLMPKP